MIHIDGIRVGGTIVAPALRARCEEGLRNSGPGASIDHVLHFFLGLAHARCSGLQEGMEDPFAHSSHAIRCFERRCDQTDAVSQIGAAEWADAHGEARDEARSMDAGAPDIFAATCLALERHARDEETFLRVALASIGMPGRPAAEMARRTATSGFSMAVNGGARAWAALLAKGNGEILSHLEPEKRLIARQLQTGSLQRFMRISRLEDLETARGEVRSLRSCLPEDEKTEPESGKSQQNPFI